MLRAIISSTKGAGRVKYEPGNSFFDEMYTADGTVRPHYQGLEQYIDLLGVPEFQRRHGMLDLAFRNQGITFTVYGDSKGTERTFPFDPVPRVIPASEWAHVEAGLTQRVRALNHFLNDIYGEAQILNDGVIPSELVYTSAHFRREVHGVTPPGKLYTHIVGTDLIRDEKGEYLVLEDNLRSPSGVSYLLSNRDAMRRIYPRMFEGQGVRSVQHYATSLLSLLQSVSPRDNGTVVVLTPGMYNSAYFEHAYLAQQMGVELVEGRDLFVDAGRVWMRTTGGRQQVDVIYRRIDDDFIDPLAFRRDSALGVSGLIEVYRQGRVAIANAVGTGVADDKAVYAYVPNMIKYYLNEDPLLNNVPTFLGTDPDHLEHIVANAASMVIKAVGEAGGYGMLIGPSASEEEVAEFVAKVKANPRDFIGQPVVGLSRHPTFYPDSGEFEGAHIDLRPYILCGKDEVTIVPGGLTRVALRRGSLVVNSSQGGGSKDTWVLDHDGPVAPQGLNQIMHGDGQGQSQSQFQPGPGVVPVDLPVPDDVVLEVMPEPDVVPPDQGTGDGPSSAFAQSGEPQQGEGGDGAHPGLSQEHPGSGSQAQRQSQSQGQISYQQELEKNELEGEN